MIASAPSGMFAISQMSFAGWALGSLGLFGLLSLLSGFVLFVAAIVVVAKSRRPVVIASFLPFVPLPLLLALFQVGKGLVASYSVIAMSDVELKNSEVAAGLAECWLSIVAGLMATMPAYLVIAFGLFIRAIQSPPTPSRGD